MKWVVKADDGTLAIVLTSGFKPPNALCEAQDDWVSDELTHSDGIIFVDPSKVHAKVLKKEKEDFYLAISRHLPPVEKFILWIKRVRLVFFYLFLIALGAFAANIAIHFLKP